MSNQDIYICICGILKLNELHTSLSNTPLTVNYTEHLYIQIILVILSCIIAIVQEIKESLRTSEGFYNA